MTNEVDNRQDVIDSRDVIARIDEIENEREFHTRGCEDCGGTGEINSPMPVECPSCCDGQIDDPEGWDRDNPEEAEELKVLKALALECEGCSDWKHGESLIRDGYFETFAQELAEEIGAIKDGAQWPYTCIDWEKASIELQQDYTSVDYDGVQYWIRS